MLLLQLRLRFQLLVQHPFLLNLLRLHLSLHPLLAGDLISRLVRVVQSINGLCKADLLLNASTCENTAVDGFSFIP